MKKMLLAIAAFAAATTARAAEYTISTLEELQEFMEYVQSYDFMGDTIKLAADIDCQGGRFNTGDPDYPSTFAGTFDGQGHTISNFVHASDGQTDYGYGVAVTRCYSAGTASGSSEVGGFAGRQYRGSPTFEDCFRPDDGLADVGTADVADIDALDAAGFLDADNFEDYLDTGKWSQIDGRTQPCFAWGLVDGKMTLSGTTAGTGIGSISGLGAYAPGTVVQISAVPSGSMRYVLEFAKADAAYTYDLLVREGGAGRIRFDYVKIEKV